MTLLSGRVEPGSQLSVVFDKTTYPAHVTSDGAWSLTIPKMQFLMVSLYATLYAL